MSKKKILLVDDEVAILESLQFNLETHGFEVIAAESGNKAFEIFKENPTDLILTDIRMPDGDGIQLLKNVRELSRSTPVVCFITGFAEISVEESYDMGAHAMFSKPFKLKDLVSRIQWLLEEEEKRWAQPVESDCDVLSLEYNNLCLGRCGLSVNVAERPSQNLVIDNPYKVLNFKTPVGLLSGVFWLRWNAHMKKLGFEFRYLEPQGLDAVIEYNKKESPSAFIPLI